jgi:hypothetical protein
MALGIEMLVERIFECPRRVVGDDGERALGGDGLAQVIGVVGLSAMTTSAGSPSISSAACGASPF